MFPTNDWQLWDTSNPHFACVEHSGYILINDLGWLNKAFLYTPKITSNLQSLSPALL